MMILFMLALGLFCFWLLFKLVDAFENI